MEAFREIVGALYVALATAAGEDVLADANNLLRDSLNAGCINDPYARTVIETLVRNTTTRQS
jgi:hypothetical protein